MEIITHLSIDKTLCGHPISVEEGCSRVSLVTTPNMAADDTGLVHGGFVFGLADYAAMIAVNHPNVVLGSAEVKFLKPVRTNQTLIADAKVEEVQGKKHWVAVSVASEEGGDAVFQGMFTCFVLEKHVLE